MADVNQKGKIGETKKYGDLHWETSASKFRELGPWIMADRANVNHQMSLKMAHPPTIPSGKQRKNNGKIHHVSWVNPRTKSPIFQFAICEFTRGLYQFMASDGHFLLLTGEHDDQPLHLGWCIFCLDNPGFWIFQLRGGFPDIIGVAPSSHPVVMDKVLVQLSTPQFSSWITGWWFGNHGILWLST